MGTDSGSGAGSEKDEQGYYGILQRQAPYSSLKMGSSSSSSSSSSSDSSNSSSSSSSSNNNNKNYNKK